MWPKSKKKINFLFQPPALLPLYASWHKNHLNRRDQKSHTWAPLRERTYRLNEFMYLSCSGEVFKLVWWSFYCTRDWWIWFFVTNEWRVEWESCFQTGSLCYGGKFSLFLSILLFQSVQYNCATCFHVTHFETGKLLVQARFSGTGVQNYKRSVQCFATTLCWKVAMVGRFCGKVKKKTKDATIHLICTTISLAHSHLWDTVKLTPTTTIKL